MAIKLHIHLMAVEVLTLKQSLKVLENPNSKY